MYHSNTWPIVRVTIHTTEERIRKKIEIPHDHNVHLLKQYQREPEKKIVQNISLKKKHYKSHIAQTTIFSHV